jgi:hypothetical protein
MRSKPLKIAKHLSGIAGEYLVAAELSRRGYIASLTLRNTQGIDVLASSADGRRQVAIQVKCDQGKGREWILTAKAERLRGPHLFYVFVRLHHLGTPEFFVVPSSVVATRTATSHRAWLARPGRRGQAHKDTAIRVFADRTGKYRDAWKRLGLD